MQDEQLNAPDPLADYPGANAFNVEEWYKEEFLYDLHLASVERDEDDEDDGDPRIHIGDCNNPYGPERMPIGGMLGSSF